MNCHDNRRVLDDYFDRVLDISKRRLVDEHIRDCAECQAIYDREKMLRLILRETSIAPLSSSLTLRVQKTLNTGRQKRFNRYTFPAIGGALAASFAIFLFGKLLATPFVADEHPTIDLSLEKQRVVNVIFDSPNSYAEVKFNVSLPDNVELAGFPDKKTVSWHGSLEKGSNLLPLKVLGKSVHRGTLVTEIEYLGKKKTFRIDLSITEETDATQSNIRT